jgi:hypothetical protein
MPTLKIYKPQFTIYIMESFKTWLNTEGFWNRAKAGLKSAGKNIGSGLSDLATSLPQISYGTGKTATDMARAAVDAHPLDGGSGVGHILKGLGKIPRGLYKLGKAPFSAIANYYKQAGKEDLLQSTPKAKVAKFPKGIPMDTTVDMNTALDKESDFFIRSFTKAYYQPKQQLCPACNTENVIVPTEIGKKIRCVKCNHMFRAENNELIKMAQELRDMGIDVSFEEKPGNPFGQPRFVNK